MTLRGVTVTGADRRTPIAALHTLSREYPGVEWGLLLSATQEGMPRFPDLRWLEALVDDCDGLILSGHLCGGWVREICSRGALTVLADRPIFTKLFDRWQLNFHGYVQSITDVSLVAHALRQLDRTIILQMDGVNDWIVEALGKEGVPVVPLFDQSGGAGVLPKAWPRPMAGITHAGYAGGLSAENVLEQLDRIAAVAGDVDIWLDVETHVRTAEQFDLLKVGIFLETVWPHVVPVAP